MFRALIDTWSQRLLGPGADRALDACIRRHAPATSGARLDVGAGFRSRLSDGVGAPIAVDISLTRLRAARRDGARPVVATATRLPFANGAFAMTASIGLLHHLSDDEARIAIREMRRVTTRGGTAIVIDAVLPERPWNRPLAWLIRRADRGHWMRDQGSLDVLLPDAEGWRRERITYAWTGLEAMVAVWRNDAL